MSPSVRCNRTDRHAGGRLASAATRLSWHTARQGAAYRSTHATCTQWLLSPPHHAPAAAAMWNIHTRNECRGRGGSRPGRWGQMKEVQQRISNRNKWAVPEVCRSFQSVVFNKKKKRGGGGGCWISNHSKNTFISPNNQYKRLKKYTYRFQ